ncbi:MAG: tRNA threonylcarbamoyladenosine dehydratase [Bacteroidales bacterium]|nr:tRNA threonylcarbamoyladenosine dehydratase [Bacteroidales bacterium]MBN2763968.1 tRNA threonylcarbamoyladenosine dehydratase [Bacteroidales bacterium]
MDNWKERTALLIGEDMIHKLSGIHILVAGLGGVGAYAAEQLCRAGIGRFTLIDGDTIQATNRNRQVIALKSTEGRHKAEVMASRLSDINPAVELEVIDAYLKEDQFEPVLNTSYDYVVDAIDTLTPKVHLLAGAFKKDYRIVSSMGSGGRLHPEQVRIADIADSNHCRFAYIVRKYLHRLGVRTGITVVYSPESVAKDTIRETSGEENKRSVVGTISYMPPIFGCYCASVVIRDLLGINY